MGANHTKWADAKVDMAIVAEMRERGATQGECAKRFGVHPRVILRLLRGAKMVTRCGPAVANCPQCGREFRKAKRATRFCSQTCFNLARRDPVDAAKICSLYASGMSMDEVAVAVFTTTKVVRSTLQRAGAEIRPAIKRDQTGPRNATWVGDVVEYKGAHNRVYAARGRPQECEHCGTTDPDVRYEWANKTRQYHDPADYMRLCRSCHVKHDGLVKNLGDYAGVAHV